MDRLFWLLEKIILEFWRLLETRIADLSPIQFMVMIGTGVGLFYFVKYAGIAFVKYGKKGVTVMAKPVQKGYIKFKKHRRGKKVCHVCKNPLHKCTCPSNKGVSYRLRLKKWIRKEKEIRRIKAQKKLEERLKNLPVEVQVKVKPKNDYYKHSNKQDGTKRGGKR